MVAQFLAAGGLVVVRREIVSQTDPNPYAPPTIDLRTAETKGCNTHVFAGRTIYVRAGYLTSRLWTLGGFTVTTETGEHFTSAQASYNEDFRWTFCVEGTPVNCRLTTRRSASPFVMPYDLTIGDYPPSSHVIRLSGAWGSLLVVPIALLILCVLATWSFGWFPAIR